MSRRSLFIVLMALVLLAAFGGVALAQSGATKQVGVVIGFPDAPAHAEIVTVPAGATSFDALKAAKVTLASQSTSFGEAVCKINNTGCPATNCFCDPANFWAYYNLNGSAWASSAEGASTVVPGDKSVIGFAWSGFDANYNPTAQPPVYTFVQLQAMANQPVPVPEPGTLMLLGSGLAGLAGYLGLKRRAAKA